MSYNTSYGVNPPPPPPPMAPQGFVGPNTVVIQQPVKLRNRHPALVSCPHCRQTVTTMPRCEVGTSTWLACGFMILVGLWLGCCLIPFCLDDLKDAHHECPNCKRVIDVYKPIS